jgi:uridine kinase
MGRVRLKPGILSIGLLSRAILIFIVTPKLQSQFYVPFLASIDGIGDPWDRWLISDGAIEAFPYGLAMLIAHSPLIVILNLLEIFQIDSLFVLTIGCLLLVLISELVIIRVMYLRKVPNPIIYFFFLNPLFIYINYVQGANDILPAALLVVSAHLLCNKSAMRAGLLLGLAIGMKYSLALSLPFFALYSYDNPRSRRQLHTFLRILLPTVLTCYLPIIFSESFRRMLASSLESSSLLRFGIPLGEIQVSIFPLIYIFLLYWLWKAGRTSVETLLIFSGTAFIAIAIANPTTPGWILWGFPLIMLLMQSVATSYLVLSSIFMFSYSTFILVRNYEMVASGWVSNHIPTISNTSFTLTIGFGTVLVISSLRQSLEIGDVYSLGKYPLVISIAGDSGVGKDTLSTIIKDAFGTKHVTEICGDDFHRFERLHPIWKSTTHLDPFVNNLKLWERNLRLARERQEFEQQSYNHEEGVFKGLMVKSKADLVISQGLHALYPNFDTLSDLKIYISMDEELRVSNKVSRDIAKRGKTREQVLESIYSRVGDSHSYIQPQREKADLVIDVVANSKLDVEIQISSHNPSFAGKLFEILNEFDVQEKNFAIDKKGRQTVGIFTTNFSGSTALSILEMHLMNFNQVFEQKPIIPDGSQGILAMVVFLALDWEKSLK